MLRIFFTLSVVLIQLSVKAQISTTDNKLYRFVYNTILVDNRFDLDTTKSKDKYDIKIISKGQFYNKYMIKPTSKNRTLEFNLSSKRFRKKRINQIFYLINPKPLRTFIVYPSENEKFDVTRDFGLIHFRMYQGQDVNYYLRKNPTNYNVTFPDGTIYEKTVLNKIDSILYSRRPAFVIIDKVESESDNFTFKSNDIDTIKFSYPSTLSLSEWCFDSKKTIVTISDENFQNALDTIKVKNNGCLYLRLAASGTQNQFILSSLEYDKTIIYNDISGGKYYLVDVSEEYGIFNISLFGDSNFSGMQKKLIIER
jgi:hypothetical protein